MSAEITERDLYDPVLKALTKELGWVSAHSQVSGRMGKVDIIGLRRVGVGPAARMLVHAVEVKRSASAVARDLRQAVGYSVMADRAYLACLSPQAFNLDDVDLAVHLGIGLIRIIQRGRGFDVEIRVEAAPQQPLASLRAELLTRGGFAECSMCGDLVILADTLRLDKRDRGDAYRPSHLSYLFEDAFKVGGLNGPRSVFIDRPGRSWVGCSTCLSVMEASIWASRDPETEEEYFEMNLEEALPRLRTSTGESLVLEPRPPLS